MDDNISPAPAKQGKIQTVSPKQFAIPLITFILGWGLATGINGARERATAVAKVNDVPITKEAFLHRLEIAAGDTTLKTMVNEQLRLQFAAKDGDLPSDSAVDAKYAALAKQPNFSVQLAASHQTPDDVRYGLKVNLIQETALVKGVTATEDEARQFYKVNTDRNNLQARYYHPESLQLQVIISNKESDIDGAVNALASGTSFEKAIQLFSKDQTRNNNGIMIVQRGRMNNKQFPGLEDKLFALQPHQQVNKTKINGGWWIIRCLARAPERTEPYDQVKDECNIGARLVKGIPINANKAQSGYADFLKSAEVTPVAPEFKDVPLKPQAQQQQPQ